jgi:hypothetical protein
VRIYGEIPQNVNALFEIQNDVDMESIGILKFAGNKEAVIRTSFLQRRLQTILLCGEKRCIFLPEAFIPTGKKTYVIVNTERMKKVEEVDGADQYILLIKQFRECMLGRHDLSAFHKMYLRNARTIDKFLALKGENAT